MNAWGFLYGNGNGQETYASGSIGRLIAMQSLSLILVVAIALMSLGPMLDHHFAERHPGHQHVFLGAADSSHSHTFDKSHAHYGSWMYGPAPSSFSSSPSGESASIIFLMPNDGAGNGATDIVAPVMMHSALLTNTDEARPLCSSCEAGHILNSATVLPSTPPPRA